MNLRNASAFAAASREERRLSWGRERAPRAAVLYDRASELDLTLPTFGLGADGAWKPLNDELRRGMDSLRICLGAAVWEGREVSAEFAAEAEEMLARGEALARQVAVVAS